MLVLFYGRARHFLEFRIKLPCYLINSVVCREEKVRLYLLSSNLAFTLESIYRRLVI